MSSYFELFRQGAKVLATDGMKYEKIHGTWGLHSSDWELLTSEHPWNQEQRRAVKTILTDVLNISLTISGLPAMPLPSEYVAAVIATLVHPVNRIVAATRAPETYSAVDASGLQGTIQIVPAKIETMISLVIAYTGGETKQPMNAKPASEKLDKELTRLKGM